MPPEDEQHSEGSESETRWRRLMEERPGMKLVLDLRERENELFYLLIHISNHDLRCFTSVELLHKLNKLGITVIKHPYRALSCMCQQENQA